MGAEVSGDEGSDDVGVMSGGAASWVTQGQSWHEHHVVSFPQTSEETWPRATLVCVPILVRVCLSSKQGLRMELGVVVLPVMSVGLAVPLCAMWGTSLVLR